MTLYDPAVQSLEEDDFATNDLTQVDAKLRSSFDVEKAWDAPELPDEVRLDLASMPDIPDANEMSSFLYGLQADLRETSRRELRSMDTASVFGNYLQMGQEADAVQAGRQVRTVSGQVARPADYGQMFLPDDSFEQDVRKVSAGITGKTPPKRATRKAAMNWQKEAARRGHIDQADVGKPWSAERYKATNRIMMQEDYRNNQTDRPGSISTNSALDLFDKWLSPTGLLSAAVAMDFLPDPGAIKREFEDWGDKWRKWRDNMTSPRDFIDAVTGPIDDIAFPIINTGLLVSGFGQTYLFARGASLAARGARGLQAGEALWEGGRFAQGASKVLGFTKMDIAAESAMMARSSFLSQKLAKSGWTGLTTTASAMDKWRSYHTVQTVKKGVQAGMRVGLAGNVENLFLPNREGGIGLVEGAGSEEALSEARKFQYQNAWTLPFSTVAEYAFQPSRVFMPGTLKGLTTPVGTVITRAEDVKQFGGDLLRNADGSLRPGLGARMSYIMGHADEAAYAQAATLRNKRALTTAVTEWWDWKLDETAQQAYRRLARQDPQRASIAAVLSMDSAEEIDNLGKLSAKELERLDEQAGRKMTFLTASAAIDEGARQYLLDAVQALPDQSDAALDAYMKIRRQFAHQITATNVHLPGTQADYERLLDAAQSTDAAVRRAAREELQVFDRQFRIYAEELIGKDWLPSPKQKMPAARAGVFDIADEGEDMVESFARSRDERISEIVGKFSEPTTRAEEFARLRAHTETWGLRAQETWATLIDNLDPTTLPVYLDEIVREGGTQALKNWDGFEGAHDLLGALREGDLYKFTPRDMATAAPFNQDETLLQGLSARLQRVDLPPEAIKKVVVNQYKGPLDLTGDTLTVGRVGTPRKQHADYLDALIWQVQEMKKWLGESPLADRLSEVTAKYDEWYTSTIPDAPGGGLAEADVSSLRKFRYSDQGRELGLADDAASKDFVRAVRWFARSGADMDDPGGWVRQVERDILDSDLTQALKLRSHSTLEELQSELRRRRKFLGSGVALQDKPHLQETQAALAAQGYELVTGQFFLNPSGVMGLDSPLAPITRHSLRRHPLATFLSKHSEDEKMALRLRRLYTGLPERMDGVDVFGDGSRASDEDIMSLVDRLDDAVRASKEQYEDTMQDASGLIARTGKRLTFGRLPRTMWDTGLLNERFMMDKLGITEQAAKKLGAAVRDAKRIGGEYNGLVELENKVVATPMLKGVLNIFEPSGAATELATRGNFVSKFTGKIPQGAKDWAGIRGEPALTGLGDFRAGRAAAGAAMGAALGYSSNERSGEQMPGWAAALTGAAVGGGAGYTGKFNPFTVRGLARTGVAIGASEAAGGMYDPETGELNPAGLAAGVGGALLAPALFRGGAKAYGALEQARGWREYSRLGSWAQGMRDYLRFTLNPWFDAQRYSEAFIMGQTKKLPDGFRLPANYSPKNTQRMLRNGKLNVENLERWSDVPIRDGRQMEQIMGGLLKQATGGRIDVDAVDVATRYFTDQGILGFSNHRWMTSAFTHLLSQGMDPGDAAGYVQDLYSYGRAGRSAAELSANFVFFPLSFMKKFVGEVGGFLLDDLSRAMVMHDSLKSFEWLNERYDLNEKMQAHLPVLEQLRIMNPLAYGLSPGEFGGINRPLFEAMYYTPWVGDGARGIANLFLPQALALETPDDLERVKKMAYRTVPVVRNVQRLIEDSTQQANVGKRMWSNPSDPSQWLSRDKEYERGVTEMEQLQESLRREAEVLGVKPRTILATKDKENPDFNDQMRIQLRDRYRAAEAEILSRYPVMPLERSKGAQKRIERQEDLKRISNTLDPEELSLGERGALEFSLMVDEFERQMEADNLTPGVDDVFDEDELDKIRSVALGLLAKYGPEFSTYYDLYWDEQFGPITESVR